MTKLTDKQEAFCREYIVDLNASQAAIRAGFSARTAGQVGHELLGKPAVSERITELKAERDRRLEVNADDVVRELARIGMFDPRKLFHSDGTPKAVTELNDATAAAVHTLDVTNGGKSDCGAGQVLKYRACDKIAALDKLMKHFGAYERDNRTEDDPLRQLLRDISGSPLNTPQGRIRNRIEDSSESELPTRGGT